jgi:DNA processing protein
LTASGRGGFLFLSLLQARVGSSLVRRLGDIPAASMLEMAPAELAVRLGLTERAARVLEELREGFDAGEVFASCEAMGLEVLTLTDPGYPERLAEIPDPPPALFVEGALPAGATVALVGSRRATATGIEAARALGRSLGERGVCVVSGLALGVDAAAHEGALEVGGPTVGVLGCGVDIVYPRRNWRLFERVLEGGALVSEYSPGEPPLRWRFPARNRIIAGLCDAVVIVEAPEKSGALITARHAAEAGRDVWAVPGPLGSLQSRGSNRLLADGAGVLWDIPEFVAGFADWQPEVGDAVPQLADGLPEVEEAVLCGVGFEPTEVDVVAARTGVGVREVLPVLTLLELKGYVTRSCGGAFVRRAAP